MGVDAGALVGVLVDAGAQDGAPTWLARPMNWLERDGLLGVIEVAHRGPMA